MKQVIVLRKDLGMRKGKMIAQGAHASGRATIFYLWHPFTIWWLFFTKFTKVAVSVNSEKELLDLYKSIPWYIPKALIQDSGKTEFHGKPTYTAFAIGPAPRNLIDKITGKLKLL